MAEVLTFGEPMGLMVADEVCPLKDVEHFTRYVCGAEVNFCIGLARLGHSVAYVSRVGRDPFGAHIRDFLETNRIDARYVEQDEEWLTGMQLKAKVEAGDPEVVNFRKCTAFSHFSPDDLKTINWEGVRHVHVTGIPVALSTNCRAASVLFMKLARQHGVQISFDPNLRPALWRDKQEMVHAMNELAAMADIVLPGIGEGKLLTGREEAGEIADFFLGGVTHTVILKVGSKGAFCKCSGGRFFESDGFLVEHVVDTVGAGDGFAVGVVSALLEGLSLQQALKRGNAIGALAVMSFGDNEGLPTRAQLDAFMSKQKG